MPRSLPDPPAVVRDPAQPGREVFVAPARAARPHEPGAEECPFCAGHEHLAPTDVLRAPADPSLPWRARIIPNRYPIVTDPPEGVAAPGAARGVHDVIVESPRHDVSILAVDDDAWVASWDLARERLARLSRRGDLAWGTVFKNSGAEAGASLAHVHSQLVALDFVPAAVAAGFGPGAAGAGEILASAAGDGRIVAESERHVALVPTAPRQPCETWILPRTPAPWFHAAAATCVEELARFVRDVVERIGTVRPRADYNWWLLQAPFAGGAPGRGWRLEIVPRISPLAGFELGTGCHVCIETPAESARKLRRRP